MKKAFAWGFVIVLLVLDWLALDDITTSNQPNFYPEYTMLTFSLVVFGLMGFATLRKKL